MFAHSLRRWPNIDQPLGVVFAVNQCDFNHSLILSREKLYNLSVFYIQSDSPEYHQGTHDYKPDIDSSLPSFSTWFTIKSTACITCIFTVYPLSPVLLQHNSHNSFSIIHQRTLHIIIINDFLRFSLRIQIHTASCIHGILYNIHCIMHNTMSFTMYAASCIL